jgi:molybdenum cofactor guanylyltransferase
MCPFLRVPSPPSVGDVDGFILAGGASSRMGTDKARAPVVGRWPMALAVAAQLRTVCGRVVLVRRGPPDGLSWPTSVAGPVERIEEPEAQDRHPLYGVAASLRSARGSHALIVPCDVPWLSRRSLQRLVKAAGSRGAVASAGGVLHPVVCVLPVDRAAEALDAARDGMSVRRFVSEIEVVELPAEELADVDRWADQDGQAPTAALAARLAHLPKSVRAASVRGEIARLAARGVIDPVAHLVLAELAGEG